jgi:nucleoid DNA-binding protein
MCLTEVHIAESLMTRTGITRVEAIEVVHHVFLLVQEGILRDGHVVVSGFGTFRNLLSEVRGPGHKYVSFRPGRETKSVLNEVKKRKSKLASE